MPLDLGRSLIASGPRSGVSAGSAQRGRRSRRRTGSWNDRARGWVAVADAELARIGGRGAATTELTPSERRAAELVGDGHSNKEIAALMFVSPKTVEANLSRVYAKLGVGSRTELVRRLDDERANA